MKIFKRYTFQYSKEHTLLLKSGTRRCMPLKFGETVNYEKLKHFRFNKRYILDKKN